MLVAVAGAHGKVAMHLHPLLAARGDSVRGLIRNPDHAEEVAAAGAEPVVCDLEAELEVDAFVAGCDAVVFAAGAGPGSGAERKWAMDFGGAMKLIYAAQRTGIRRFVMISAMGAADLGVRERMELDAASPRGSGEDVFAEYLRAKAEADAALRGSGLDYTIARPGRLTDEPGTGRITAGGSVDRGEIPRADAAAVIAAVVAGSNTIGKTFEVVSGPDPINAAIAAFE